MKEGTQIQSPNSGEKHPKSKRQIDHAESTTKKHQQQFTFLEE
jgi:hypothetical protein